MTRDSAPHGAPLRVELFTLTKGRYSPLSLGYLKAYALQDARLRDRVDIRLDSRLLGEMPDLAALAQDIAGRNPDVVGLSCYVWNIRLLLELAERIKKLAPAAWIVIGGPEVGPRALDVIQSHSFLDAVVVGEGEETFNEVLCRRLEDGALEGVAGVAFRHGGVAQISPSRTPIACVDAIPSPYALDILDVGDDEAMQCVETHRGCVFSCHFCFYHKSYGTTRYFSQERVRSDLDLLTRTPANPAAVRSIYLMDPTFNENLARAKAVCRLIESLGPRRARYHAEIRAELLDPELVDLMKRCRFETLEVGLQTSTDSVQSLIKRGWNRKAFVRGIQLLNAAELPYELQLIFGLPDETWETFLDSVRFTVALEPPCLAVFPLLLLPGTVLRQRAEELGIGFDPLPPYQLTSHRSISEVNLRRGVLLAPTLDFLYNKLPTTHLAAIGALCRQPPGDLVDVALDFVDWYRACHGDPEEILGWTMSRELFERFLSDSLECRVPGAQGFYGAMSRLELPTAAAS